MKRLLFCSALATTILFSACSTDLDVIGDYKETIVVYGLLDQALDTQYVKINKAFLGAGDAFGYAQVKDSTQFVNALNVKINRIKNGVTISSVNLVPTNKPKDPGVFYSANQANAIYSFYSPRIPTASAFLNTDSEYQLVVTNNETGTVVTGKTTLITDVTGFTNPVASGTTFSFVIAGPYPNYPFNVIWNSAKNARLYQVVLRLNYTDSTATGGNIARTIEYVLPNLKTTNITALPPEELGVYMKGSDFYRYIGNTLTSYPGLIRRTAGKVDLLLVAGSDELSTFIDVNIPSTGIVQERPEYTNITNGLGIFSSRLNRAALSRPLESISLDSLACGRYTKTLKFLNSLSQVNAFGQPVTCP